MPPAQDCVFNIAGICKEILVLNYSEFLFLKVDKDEGRQQKQNMCDELKKKNPVAITFQNVFSFRCLDSLE